MTFPDHKCGLYLTHNEHRDTYTPLWQHIEEDRADWRDEESKKRAIETDECWTLQWYPDTPIGFFRVSAPTLEECLALATKEPRP